MNSTIKQVGIGVAGAVAVIGVMVVAGKGAGSPVADPSKSIASAAVASALTAAGCDQLLTQAPAGATNTVLLVSRTGVMAGAGIPDVVSRALVASAGGGNNPVGGITVVMVGGIGEHPTVVADDAALMDPSAGSARQGRIAANLGGCLTTMLDAARLPSAPGSDELLAEQVAGQAAQAARQGGSSRVSLFVISDGEANTGLLDLRQQGFDVLTPASVVRRVAQRNEAPSFEGLNVTYVGLGQGLDGASRAWLTSFYTGLCTAAGGTCRTSADQVPVGPVSGKVAVDPAITAIAPVPGVPNAFEVSAAAFQADTTSLVDPALVSSQLRQIEAQLRTAPGAVARVVGHVCDDGSPAAALQLLSVERARAIAALLTEAGVPSNQVTAIGVGATQPTAASTGLPQAAACSAERRVDITIGGS